MDGFQFDLVLSVLTTLSTALATTAILVGVTKLWAKAPPRDKKRVDEIAEAVRTVAPIAQGTEREWELVQRLVTEYHEQALSQARVQFWFSVLAASAGFMLVIGALGLAFLKEATTQQFLIQVIPGLAIEAVAGLFFKQAGETRERATALYDRLRSDRQRADSVAIVNTIDNADVRNAVKAELALHVAGLQASPLGQLLPSLLGVGRPERGGAWRDSPELQVPELVPMSAQQPRDGAHHTTRGETV